MLILWTLLASLSLAGAEDSALTGEAIAKKVFAQEFMGTAAGISKLRMTLSNKRGETRQRQLFSRSATIEGQRRTMVRFLAPADVQGTSFLLIEQRGRGDDQYLYLPALKRTRRIAGRQRHGAFMGSDFSYADMETREVEESTWERLGDDAIGKVPCYRIVATPKNAKDADYGRSEMWIHKETWLPLKMKLFDKRGKTLKKTLFVEQFKNVDDRWMVTRARMRNEKKGTATLIEIEEIDLKTPVPADALTVEALSKG